MKVLALQADHGGCAKYRILEPARVLRDQFSLDITIKDEVDVAAIKDKKTGIYTINEIREEADLIILQRPLNNYGVELVRQAREQGIATIVELDDDFESLHPHNSAWKLVQPEFNQESNKDWLRKTCLNADLVTVSTPTLAKKYFSEIGGAKVLPNLLPRSIFDIKRDTRYGTSLNIGWSGTIASHPNDFPVIGGALKSVLSSHKNSQFVIIGTKAGIAEQVGVPSKSVRSTGMVPLDRYYQTLVDSIDIGIVPLELTEFNNAKSYLKLMEFSALGIPTIASPTEPNLFLNSKGVGLIAENPTQWKKYLALLLRDGRKRTSLVRTAREILRNEFTYEDHAHLWLNAWQEAIDISKTTNVKKLVEIPS